MKRTIFSLHLCIYVGSIVGSQLIHKYINWFSGIMTADDALQRQMMYGDWENRTQYNKESRK